MKKSFPVEGLCCANCALRLEKGVNKIDGVEEAIVSFATQKITIEAEDDKFPEILEKAQSRAKKLDPSWKIITD